MVEDVIRIINHTYIYLGNSLHFSIFHCNELTTKSIGRLVSLAKPRNTTDSFYVQVVNLCDNPIYNSTRTRGFFCKPAALIESPYVETILIDTDTIWFESPEHLFDSPSYLRTGALFFRDRFLFQSAGQPNCNLHQSEVIEFIRRHNPSLQISPQFLESQRSKFNNLFWRFPLPPDPSHATDSETVDVGAHPGLQHIQDSSVVVLDKSRHPKTLSVLASILATFSLGYGDKEIYWISATVAQEPYEFEPHLFGIYGDCGALLHFDPRQPPLHPWIVRLLTGLPPPLRFLPQALQRPTPFFMNAEYLLDCASRVGEHVESLMSSPTLVTEDIRLFSMTAPDEMTLGLCGACALIGCIPVPDRVNRLIELAQEHHIQSSRHLAKTETGDCVARKRRASMYQPFQLVRNSGEGGKASKALLEDLSRIQRSFPKNSFAP